MGNITGKVLDLKSSVKYQKGSVVSKEIIRSEKGNVTIFSFDRGEGLSEHTSPYDAMVYIMEGKGEIKISSRAHHLEEGQMIIMPRNKPHALYAEEPFKMMLVMIR